MKLSNENIDKAVEEVRKFFERAKVSKRDLLKINLIAEESLLRFQGRFGEDQEFTLKTKKWFGTPKVIIRLKGAFYNPLESKENDVEILSAQVMKNLLNYETAGTSYDYKDACNEITIFSTREQKPMKVPGGSITIAVVLAVICAFIAGHFPQNVQDFLVDDFSIPVVTALLKLIVGVTIPTIFVSVVSSLCVMDDIATLNDIGLKVIKRFFLNMLFIIAVTIFCCEATFHVISLDTGGNSNFQSQVITLLLSVIPDSLFRPFIEGNILQIALIAFAVGACIVILGKRISTLKMIINEARDLLFRVMELTLKIVPLTIFFGIFETVMTTSLDGVAAVWKIVLVTWLSYLVTIGIWLIFLKLKYKINIADFIKKNGQMLNVAFTVGTMPAMIPAIDTAKKEFKMETELVDFWVPLSYALFSPGNAVKMTACVFIGAALGNATLSVSQLIVLVFLSVQLSIVCPKVHGGSVATYTILLNQFNFDLEAVGLLMIAEVFTSNVAAVFGMFIRSCELFDISHKISFHSGTDKNETQQ